MVQLNVRGLLARDASAVAQAVDAGSQDVMVFTETWLRRDAEAPEISGFTAVLNLPRSKRMEKRAEEESATCTCTCTCYILCSHVSDYSTGSQGAVGWHGKRISLNCCKSDLINLLLCQA